MRAAMLAKLKDKTFDVLIIGGGINGAVSLAATAARGLQVALVDRGDFAGQTSQESSYLAWGGIKYLENYEFGLVRDLCLSRNKLMRAYPSSVREIRFFCPHKKGFKHGLFKLYFGSWFYWLMGNGFTRRPRFLTRKKIVGDEPSVNMQTIDGGFEYSDSFLMELDARFVYGFIRQSMEFGSVPVNYVEVTGSRRDQSGLWLVELQDKLSGESFSIKTKSLVNAAGPFVDHLNQKDLIATKTKHVLSKGIHLIVPRITKEERVLTFIADDNRMFFVLPLGPVSCVGTTDTRIESMPAVTTDDDRDFVLTQINTRLNLATPLTRDDIIAERCGARPLAITNSDSNGSGGKDFLSLSRKHVIESDTSNRHISIFGGKLTDCLNVGQEICEELISMGFELKPEPEGWFGEPSQEMRSDFFEQAARLPIDEASTAADPQQKPSQRLWRRYGLDAFSILARVRENPRSGEILPFGVEILKAEIEHMRDREYVACLDDFLRRRTYLSLIHKKDDLKKMPHLREAVAILFGDRADQEWDKYFNSGDRHQNNLCA